MGAFSDLIRPGYTDKWVVPAGGSLVAMLSRPWQQMIMGFGGKG